MLKRHLIIFSLLCMLFMGNASAEGNDALPYAIRVNRATNVVTVYTQDEAGEYTVPYKAMFCSTARPGLTTPIGSYTLQAQRYRWRIMLDGTYGQYATRFKGHFLFHSVCYSDDSNDAMIREAYNNLGNGASMGCVRLQTADSKWIYDNCPGGTSVTVYDDPNDYGPLGKPEKLVSYISEEAHNGWDPTDPAEGNPWIYEPSALTLENDIVSLTAGESAQIKAFVEPRTAYVSWSSSDESIAQVSSEGVVTALREGAAEIKLTTHNGLTAVCTVEVRGELLPFDDLVIGAWYYPEVRQALEMELLEGAGERVFAPDTPATRAEIVQALYSLAGKPRVSKNAKLPFADVEKDSDYRKAVVWAVSKGIVQGASETEFEPHRPMTRQELAAVLWRYAQKPQPEGELTAFTDHGSVHEYARQAMAWTVGEKVIKGSDGRLEPMGLITRAEASAVFCRMPQK